MKKFIAPIFLVILSGCLHAPTYKVYGVSGIVYTDKEMCAAVAACHKAGETQCYYPQSVEYNCGELPVGGKQNTNK